MQICEWERRTTVNTRDYYANHNLCMILSEQALQSVHCDRQTCPEKENIEQEGQILFLCGSGYTNWACDTANV